MAGIRAGVQGTDAPKSLLQKTKDFLYTPMWGDGSKSGLFQSNFMPPGTPPPIVVEVDPRYLDYDAYRNINWDTEPGRGGITIQQLRTLADEYEPLRGVIENRKNQIYAMKIAFKLKEPKGKTPDAIKTETENSDSIRKCKEFFKKPDGDNSLKAWIRVMLEELLVTDYVCIYKQKYLNGRIEAKLVDCSTILKRIDKYGGVPATGLAYQQKIKGVITHDFTRDEMIVYHRNPRVYKHYGYAPVEQIIRTVNTGLRRSEFQLSYYTEGNIPDMLLRVTAGWSDEQLARYQKYFDLLMAGNLGARRKIRFIPEAMEPIFPQKDALKDEFDEWLMRIICYVFGVSHAPFVKMMNRATGEQQREQADEEGMFAWMETIKEVIDTMISDWLGLDDVEMSWKETKTQDSLKQSQIDESDVKNGIRSRDEVREDRGLPPAGIGLAVTTAHGIVGIVQGQEDHIEEAKTKIDETLDKKGGSDTSTNSP